MATKKTNRELYAEVLSVIAIAEIAEDKKTELSDFLKGRVEQLDKKASTVTKAQREKAEADTNIANLIIEGLTAVNQPIRISDLIKTYKPLNEYSTQKLSPIFTKLVNDGKIEKVSSKRTILYVIKTAV